MAEYEIGSLVRSKAGHDAGGCFIIIKEDPEYVYLADGRNRPVGKPKRKKKKHVQTIRRGDECAGLDEALRGRLFCGDRVTDEEIKYFLKQWNRENSENR